MRNRSMEMPWIYMGEPLRLSIAFTLAVVLFRKIFKHILAGIGYGNYMLHAVLQGWLLIRRKVYFPAFSMKKAAACETK